MIIFLSTILFYLSFKELVNYGTQKVLSYITELGILKSVIKSHTILDYNWTFRTALRYMNLIKRPAEKQTNKHDKVKN